MILRDTANGGRMDRTHIAADWGAGQPGRRN